MPLTLQYYSFPFLPPFSEIKEPYPAANAPARKHRWISYAEEQLSVDAKSDRASVKAEATAAAAQ